MRLTGSYLHVIWSFEQLHCCPLSVFSTAVWFSLSDSSPCCRVVLPCAARNKAWKLNYNWVFHLAGLKKSMVIRNTTSSLAPKLKSGKNPMFLVFKWCFGLFFKLGLIGIFKDPLFYVWYGLCVLADFNLFQWVAGRTRIACYVCFSVALPGDKWAFCPCLWTLRN